MNIRPLTAAMLLALSYPAGAELYFPSFLVSEDPDSVADLSHLTPEGTQLPGSYEVEIYLNDTWLATRRLNFVSADSVPQPAATQPAGPDVQDDTGLMACLTPADWREAGLKTEAVPAMAGLADDACVSPGRYIPKAFMAWDFDNLRLNISIPQAMLKNRPRGWIPPERWDDGIPALLTGYRLSGSSGHTDYGSTRNLYLSLNNGLNIGAWRLRDNRSWSSYTSGGHTRRHQERLSTYLERAVTPWRSWLLFGESTTGGDLFDGFAFRGVSLTTDDSMYPDTLRGYAPVVRGTATGNARVTIRQNGSEVYQTFVPPGDFVIDDLYAVTTGGDLEVTVTEPDGTTRTFIVPYASVPLLQREGRLHWSAVAGRYRSNSSSYGSPAFAQGTLQWGLPYGITTYAGIQAAERYRAGLLGAGMNMGRWGAFTVDVTHAESRLADDTRHSGQSVRFLYSRALNALGTMLNLTGYRYSTEGFHTLDETALKRMRGWMYDDDESNVDANGRPVERPYTDYYNLYNTRRARVMVNISQKVGTSGSLYLNGSRQTYWNSDERADSLMAGYSDMLGPVSYSLSWSYSRAGSQPHADRMMYLSFSLPFSALLSGKRDPYDVSRTRLTGSVSNGDNGRSSYMAGMSGSLLEDYNLGWNVQQGYTRYGGNDNGSSHSSNASVDYHGTYGSTSLGYSHSPGYRQVNYEVSGGAVLHRNGLTLGQTPGTTSILVAVPGAAGVPLMNGTGVKTDWRGYALLPYGSEYRENRVELDTRYLDGQTDIEETVTQVVPTRGALVRAEFKARNGVRALVTLTHNGKPLPFGTTVSDATGNTGITGDEGEVYLSGLEREGVLTAQWGSQGDQRCTAHYRLKTETTTASSLAQFTEVCE